MKWKTRVKLDIRGAKRDMRTASERITFAIAEAQYAECGGLVSKLQVLLGRVRELETALEEDIVATLAPLDATRTEAAADIDDGAELAELRDLQGG